MSRIRRDRYLNLTALIEQIQHEIWKLEITVNYNVSFQYFVLFLSSDTFSELWVYLYTFTYKFQNPNKFV
jgi:hypothetical protein